MLLLPPNHDQTPWLGLLVGRLAGARVDRLAGIQVDDAHAVLARLLDVVPVGRHPLRILVLRDDVQLADRRVEDDRLAVDGQRRPLAGRADRLEDRLAAAADVELVLRGRDEDGLAGVGNVVGLLGHVLQLRLQRVDAGRFLRGACRAASPALLPVRSAIILSMSATRSSRRSSRMLIALAGDGEGGQAECQHQQGPGAEKSDPAFH